MTFYTRTEECEAMQWEVYGPNSGVDALRRKAKELVAWVNSNGGEARYEPDWQCDGAGQCSHPTPGARIAIRTKEGWGYAAPGWYIVKGYRWFHSVDGSECRPDNLPCPSAFREFTVCDPKTFEKYNWTAR